MVHGDIGGNILLHPDLPPAVIDLSPYWTPVGFGEAVMVVDAVLWERADLRSMLALGKTGAAFGQLVVRAAVRRLLEVDCHHRLNGFPESHLDETELYRRFAEKLAGVENQT
jgi:hypothetical protein